MASGLAAEMGNVATVGLAPAVFGLWMNISGATLASWWRRRALDDATDSVNFKDVNVIEPEEGLNTEEGLNQAGQPSS